MNKKMNNLIEELEREARESNVTVLVALNGNDRQIHLGIGEERELAWLHLCYEMNLCEELGLTSEELRSIALSQALEKLESSSSAAECPVCGTDRREKHHKYCVICGTKFQEG